MAAEAKAKGRTFRFGVFEMDEETGELRKEGKTQARLREQAARILLMLLERPRELVMREELRERLWASDTFVDFDHGVNTAINQLRNALGDEAGNPRFIQTLPRKGYRFIAPVEIAEGAGGEFAGAAEGAEAEARRSTVLSDARDLPTVSSGVARTLFLLIQLIYLIFYVLSLARIREVDALLKEAGEPARVILVALVVTAAAGIPTRLYLITAAAFNYRGLGGKFRRLFPVLLPLDELWALAPFLAVEQIGIGAAIAVTAALLYLPFAQRSLMLMGTKRGNP
jgi:cholera toxin transcriptional activator